MNEYLTGVVPPLESDPATATGAPPEGVPLDRWLDEAPRPWRAILNVFMDVGQELAATHTAGIAHQEIRLENVIVASDGHARLWDLKPIEKDLPTVGPAGLRTAAVSLEQRLDEMRSTDAAAYLAPEQFKGWVADARSNQFSYCNALYRALYQQAPFDHEWAVSQVGEAVSRRTPLGSVHFALVVKSMDRTSMIHLAREVLGGNLRPPPDDTDVPGWLEQIIRRGLQPDPDERFGSMDDLLEAVEVALGGTIRARKVARRRDVGKWAVIAGLGLAVLLAILAKLGQMAGWIQ